MAATPSPSQASTPSGSSGRSMTTTVAASPPEHLYVIDILDDSFARVEHSSGLVTSLPLAWLPRDVRTGVFLTVTSTFGRVSMTLNEALTASVLNILGLPDEIAFMIFSLLGAVDLVRASLVCHSWRRLAHDHHLWRSLRKAKFGTAYALPRLLNSPFTDYAHRSRLHHSWLSGAYTTTLLKDHKDVVSSVKLLEGAARLATGSYDTTASLYVAGQYFSPASGKTERIFQKLVTYACTSPVNDIDLDDTHLLTGETIQLKLWDQSRGAVTRSLEGHTSVVWTCRMGAAPHTVVSGGQDRTVKLWDSRLDNSCVASYTHHRYSVQTVRQIDPNYIWSCGEDWRLACVDVRVNRDPVVILEMNGCCSEFGIHGNRIAVGVIPHPADPGRYMSLLARGLSQIHIFDAPGELTSLPSYLEYPGGDKLPDFWRVIDTPQGALHGLLMDDVKLVSAGRPLVCMWDAETFESQRVFSEHESNSVMCADMLSDLLVSGDVNGLIVRDFS